MNFVYHSEEEKMLMEPVIYYSDLKGKGIRKYISKVLGTLLAVDESDIKDVDEVISMVHNASLVVDDIQDDSKLRRNKPCAHIKYGVPLSINASYLCIFKLLNDINKRSDISENIKHKIVDNIYYTHIGQGMDIYYTQENIIPTLENYNKMMEYKTGMLFYTILDLLMEKTKNVIIKKKYDELKRALYNFALFFQIRDDYINLTDPTYWKQRGFCQDFDEQKVSYLITYCNNNKLDNYEQINQLVSVKDKTDLDKVNILQLMNNNGLFGIVYNQMLQLKQSVLNVIDVNLIFEQLPFKIFDLNDLTPFQS